MKVCIVDDIKITVDSLMKMVESASSDISISGDIKESIECNAFYNLNDFNKWLDVGNIVDICFLDINFGVKSENGLEVAKRLKNINYKTLIIFISDYNNYYMDMVQVEPFRFLHKPLTYEDVIPIFKLACERYFLQNSNRICSYKYTYNGITFSVDLNEIKYICSQKRKIYLYSENDIGEFYGKLDNVEKEITTISDYFLRINKSYLVNTNYIENFGKNELVLDNQIFTISSKYKDNVISKLKIL